jgi:hypothetical protein
MTVDLSWHEGTTRLTQIELANAHFDCNFLIRQRAHEFLI